MLYPESVASFVFVNRVISTDEFLKIMKNRYRFSRWKLRVVARTHLWIVKASWEIIFGAVKPWPFGSTWSPLHPRVLEDVTTRSSRQAERLDIFIKHDRRRCAENVNYRTRHSTINYRRTGIEISSSENYLIPNWRNYNYGTLESRRSRQMELGKYKSIIQRRISFRQ